MELTLIGLIQIAIGTAIVLAGSANATFAFLFFSALFEGSAAILLPALGGSSIPPSQFALLFVTLRIFMPSGGLYGCLPDAVRANAWLVLFCLYGVAMSYIGPRLFAGRIDIYPMRPDATSGLFDTVPLKPTSQNLTGGIYMLGTLLLALVAFVHARMKGAAETLVHSSIWGGWFCIATGLIDVLTRGTPLDQALEVFRNSSYAQTNAEIGGFIRIRGLMPEASAYAAACFVFFIVNAELWYRSVLSRETGRMAVLLAAILVFSTSSSAYVSLAIYMVVALLRALVFPGMTPRGKLKRASVVGFWILFLVAVMIASVPELWEAISTMILQMTVEKSSSESGQQRLFWAMQGLHAAIASYGLGIGPGSFRSSSIIMAILGSMGVIGIASFTLYLLSIFQPNRQSSWGQGDDLAQTLGGAFASAAVLSLVPAMIGSPQASPGAIFSIFAGAALALRPTVRLRRRPAPST